MKVTGSKLPLIMACPASAALPVIDEPPGEPAIRGSVIHRFVELAANVGRDEALALAPEDMRQFLRALDLEALPIDLMPEAAFALDWRNRSARFLGSGIDRNYGEMGPTEIGLTTDVYGVSDDAVLVEDYKTGHTRYGNPETFGQLLAGALAACYVTGRDEARVGLLYIDSNGDSYPVRGRVDGWTLDQFAHDLEVAMEGVGEARARLAAGVMPDVHPGEHCDGLYCPAFRACPAQSALVRHMPEHLAEIQRPGYMAPERLAKTWKQIQVIRDVIGKIETEIRALSLRDPIELGDGWWLGPKELTRETLDAATAQPVIAGILGDVAAANAVTLEVTKAAIEREAKAWRDVQILAGKKPRQVAMTSKDGDGILDRIYAEITARGGTKTTTTRNPVVHRRKS